MSSTEKQNGQIATSSIFLLAATFMVNVANYGLNLILGRWLGLEGFAEANIIATLVMVLSFAAMGLQLTTAKLAASDEKNYVRRIRRYIIISSLMATALLVSFAPGLANFLQFKNSYSLMIIFIGIPFYFLMSMSRGFFQGEMQFDKLAWTYILEMVIRVAVTISLLLFFQGTGLDTMIVAIGFLLSFVVTYAYGRVNINLPEEGSGSMSNALYFLGVIALYELSQIMINNSDVILVKHYFSPENAGLYASMALLGRAVFFATWTVVTIMFPKVIEKEKRGEPHDRLFWISLSIVAGIGSMMVVGSYLFGDVVMQVAFGPAYAETAQYLWVYALLTAFFSCANVFVYYYMSLEKYLPVFISLVAGALQIILVCIFHNTIEQVLYVQSLCMAGLLSIMVLYRIFLVRISSHVRPVSRGKEVVISRSPIFNN